MAAFDVLDTLERHYPTRTGAWVFVRELAIPHARICPGFEFWGGGRMDAYAIGCWMSTKFERHAFEVKCSRSDLRAELATPHKRSAAVALSDRFYFVLAESVRWDDLEIPEECGVMVATSRGIEVARKAPLRSVPALPAPFVASFVRRASGWLLNPPASINEWGQIDAASSVLPDQGAVA